MVIDQEAIKKSEPVILTVRSLSEKMAVLDREVKYLVNKLKIWKPKTPPPPPVSEKPVHEKPPVKQEYDEDLLNKLMDDIKEKHLKPEDVQANEEGTPEVEEVTEKATGDKSTEVDADDDENHQEL